MSAKPKKKPALANSDRSAWLQLYKAQKTRMPQAAPVTGRGRPARIASLMRINTLISPGDKDLLLRWQAIFKAKTGRTLTLGEVAGFLARVCMTRMEVLKLSESAALPESVDELVALLVGEARPAAPRRKA